MPSLRNQAAFDRLAVDRLAAAALFFFEPPAAFRLRVRQLFFTASERSAFVSSFCLAMNITFLLFMIMGANPT